MEDFRLAAPIPLKASRSFQLLPNRNKQQAYPFHRSMSFGSQKEKDAAAASKKEKKEVKDEKEPSNKGIPLLRRLSFRGKKEMKAQLAGGEEKKTPPKPPLSASTPPKPPRSTPKKGALPKALLEEAIAKK